MRLVYFEGRNGQCIAIVASSIVAITQNCLPTDTPVRISCINGQFNVRGSIDDAQEKYLRAAQEVKHD